MPRDQWEAVIVVQALRLTAVCVQDLLRAEEVKSGLSDVVGVGGEAEVSGVSPRFLLSRI